eukprot:5780143-Pyramimonas_sp.AAC.1
METDGEGQSAEQSSRMFAQMADRIDKLHKSLASLGDDPSLAELRTTMQQNLDEAKSARKAMLPPQT